MGYGGVLTGRDVEDAESLLGSIQEEVDCTCPPASKDRLKSRSQKIGEVVHEDRMIR